MPPPTTITPYHHTTITPTHSPQADIVSELKVIEVDGTALNEVVEGLALLDLLTGPAIMALTRDDLESEELGEPTRILSVYILN